VHHYVKNEEVINNSQRVSHDRVHVYRREAAGGSPGKALNVTRVIHVETQWDSDGLQTGCEILSHVRCEENCGYGLLALPLVSGGEDIFSSRWNADLSEDLTSPEIWWCMSRGPPHPSKPQARSSPYVARNSRLRGSMHLMNHTMDGICEAALLKEARLRGKLTTVDRVDSPREGRVSEIVSVDSVKEAIDEADELVPAIERIDSEIHFKGSLSGGLSIGSGDLDLSNPGEWNFLTSNNDEEDSWGSDSGSDLEEDDSDVWTESDNSTASSASFSSTDSDHQFKPVYYDGHPPSPPPTS